MRKLSGITPERDDFVELSSRSGSLQEHDVSRRQSPIKQEQAVSGPWSVATYAPANEDEKITVCVPQASGQEITVSLLAATAPLGYALADPLAQAPAQASLILLFLSVLPVADPFADATP